MFSKPFLINNRPHEIRLYYTNVIILSLGMSTTTESENEKKTKYRGML